MPAQIDAHAGSRYFARRIVSVDGSSTNDGITPVSGEMRRRTGTERRDIPWKWRCEAQPGGLHPLRQM